METLDTIRKLLRLATNNPSREEASAAALKAAQLIIENEVPIGDAEIKVRADSPLTQEEQAEFKDVMNALSRRENPDEFKPAFVYPTTEIDDEFMKKRILDAWRQIRRERKILDGEIRRYESETRRKYTGTGHY
jgi:hypothetical protein